MNFPGKYYLAKAGPEAIITAAVVLAASIFLSRELSGHGLDAAFASALPLLSVLLILSRWDVFAVTIPAALFVCLGTIGISGMRIADGQLSLALGSLALLAAVARFQTGSDQTDRSITTSRWNYTPVPKVVKRTRATWHLSKLATLAIFVLAWLFAGLACAELIEISNNPKAYQEYLEGLRADIGLEIPEVYIGMKLLIGMALICWLAHAVFAYHDLLKPDGEAASMHLRSELWKWNGPEQRMISNQLRKNQI